MDTVILAAGKGERLNGITAPYHKPLLVINGRPLVQTAVDIAFRACHGNVIVVVAPENAAPISHVLGERPVRMIVQRFPIGPGPALAAGLLLAETDEVMVLMGDNVSTYADVHKVAQASWGIGTQYVNPEEAERFTYWRCGQEQWVEKVRPTRSDLDPSIGMALAWVGPVVVHRLATLEFYSQHHVSDIGPNLDKLIPGGQYRAHVSVSTYDIGVPEALA